VLLHSHNWSWHTDPLLYDRLSINGDPHSRQLQQGKTDLTVSVLMVFTLLVKRNSRNTHHVWIQESPTIPASFYIHDK